MIRVIVELHRAGERPQELARIEISNAGGTPVEADYSVQSVARLTDGSTSIQQRGLWGFQRRRWNVLGLLHTALEAIGKDAMLDHDHFQIPERLD